ncbi:MAG TPA: hypothetical protein VF943_01635 [Burkholderiales bacterium]
MQLQHKPSLAAGEAHPASPGRRIVHLDSTRRALEASRDILVLMCMCNKAMARIRNEVNEPASTLASKMSQHLYCVDELAKQLRREIELLADDRLSFWERR